MSDQKYRQHGYRDSDRDRQRTSPAGSGPRRAPEPYDPRVPRDPKVPNMPGFRDVFRCARCGHIDTPDVGLASRCKKCGADQHTCSHCGSFDPGARFECRETIPARISPKDQNNACQAFTPRIQVERETGSSRPNSAKKAFDDLFNF
jgi:hypothetical protein